MGMRVLVAGATGSLGSEVVRRLMDERIRVRALVRDPKRLRWAPHDLTVGDLLEPGGLPSACHEVDAVVSAAGASPDPYPSLDRKGFAGTDLEGHRNLLAAALDQGVRRFVYVSVHHPPEARETAYVRAHEAFVEELRGSGISYGVVRPTGFFSSFRPFRTLARIGMAPLPGPGTARTNPIHEADLAEVCQEVLEADASVEVEVGGPDVLTRREIAELAFRVRGARPRILPLPGGVLSLGAAFLAPFDRRGAEFLEFFRALEGVDVVAPARGRLRLEEYFRGGS